MLGSDKAICGGHGTFHLQLWAADRNQLIGCRLGAAIPGFTKKWNARLRHPCSGDGWSSEPGRGVRRVPDALECGRPRFLAALCARSDFLSGLAQGIEARIGILPG